MVSEWPLWFSLGGKSSIHCAGSWELLSVTILLCLGISLGYLLIAIDWHNRESTCSSIRGRAALRDLRTIFIWCAISGYVFRVILSVYPFWSGYLISLVWLNWITWRYINKLKKLDIIYKDSEKLEQILDRMRYSKIIDPAERLQAIQNDLSKYLERE